MSDQFDGMPRWRSHKVVQADKICMFSAGAGETATVQLETGGVVMVPRDVFARGVPELGDYLVRYEDGYLSWSPRSAFEGGYTRIHEGSNGNAGG
jgi:hypothetical protein